MGKGGHACYTLKCGCTAPGLPPLNQIWRLSDRPSLLPLHVQADEGTSAHIRPVQEASILTMVFLFANGYEQTTLHLQPPPVTVTGLRSDFRNRRRMAVICFALRREVAYRVILPPGVPDTAYPNAE